MKLVNYFFTTVFLVECLLKLTALGPIVYFHGGWNQFDFFVVVCSIVDLIMVRFSDSSIQILTVGP